MTVSNPLDALKEQAENAWKQAQYANAEQLYQQVLALQEQQLGPDHPETAETLNNLGDLAHTQGAYASAEIWYRRALSIRENVFGREHPATIRSIGDLAGIRDEQGDAVQAEALYQEALTLSEQVQGAVHLDTALALAKLARFYRATGKYDQAKVLYQQALAIYEQNAEDPGNHATCLNNFAALLLELDRPTQAEPLLRQALRIRTRLSGPEHPALAASLKNLGRAYNALGDTILANILYQRALAIYEQKLGVDHPDTIAIKQQIASLRV
jgi:tetratricopeptide (TPR) repeat protein